MNLPTPQNTHFPATNKLAVYSHVVVYNQPNWLYIANSKNPTHTCLKFYYKNQWVDFLAKVGPNFAM